MEVLDDIETIVKVHNAIYGFVDSFRSGDKGNKDIEVSDGSKDKEVVAG